MAEKIYVDENNNVLRRETLRKGRPIKGSVKMQEDSDWYKKGDIVIYPIKDDAFISEYIDVDEEGNVIKREKRGRGRTRPGYTKQEDGNLKGHWVKVVQQKEKNIDITNINDVNVVTNERLEVS